MGFPDRVERTVAIPRPPADVLAALTTAEGLSAWFGDRATVDLRPGGAGELGWPDGSTRAFRVERVEEPSAFGFTWPLYGLDDDDPRCTYVEFTLQPDGSGTRLTVVATGFAQMPDDAHHVAFEGNSRGWVRELGELVDCLSA